MIIRSLQQSHFAMIPNTFANCTKLSWGARGIGLYLLSKPANWKVMITDLVNAGTSGKQGVYTLLDELIEAGYLYRKDRRSEKGTFESHDYVMYDFPYKDDSSDPQPAEPEVAEPEVAEPEVAKQPLQRHKENKTELNKAPSAPAGQPSLLEEVLMLDKETSTKAPKQARIAPKRRALNPWAPVPTDRLLAIWKARFPTKSQPQELRGSRNSLLSARWADGYKREYYANHEDGIQWWDQFLGWCAKNPVFAKPFFSFDFLIKPENFDKVIEGNYRE